MNSAIHNCKQYFVTNVECVLLGASLITSITMTIIMIIAFDCSYYIIIIATTIVRFYYNAISQHKGSIAIWLSSPMMVKKG